MDRIKEARRAFALTAQQVAAATVNGPIERFAPGSRMSRHAHWFRTVDDDVLVAVVAHEEKPAVADEVLAYGLAWQRNRDLHLVMPPPMIPATLGRLPWVETKVRLFVLEGPTPRPVPTLPRIEVFERLRLLPQRISKKANLTAEHESWLAKIETSTLEPHHRSYRSFHHQGLQVLKASSTRQGLRVQAGVQYSNPAPGQEPYDRTFAVAPTRDDVVEINEVVAQAVGLGGSATSQMREHRMQAVLASQPGELGLDLLLREFPAYRGLDARPSDAHGRPGYIDFLGVDATGRFHVVETKIGHDPKVVLQALDYAIWVRANEKELRSRLRAEGHDLPDPSSSERDRLHIHLVLGPGANGVAFNGYLAPQVEALTGDCSVHVRLVPEPSASPLTFKQLGPRDMWQPHDMVAAPVVGPRWAQTLTNGLLEVHE